MSTIDPIPDSRFLPALRSTDIDPIASRLLQITEQLGTSGRRLVQHDEKGRIVQTTDVPTDHRRLAQEGLELMRGAWSHHPATVDIQGRFEQLDSMRIFAQAVADHVPEQTPEEAALMREYHRQATNAIRLHYHDPRE